MSSGTKYELGPATGAEVDKRGEEWTLIVRRELRHPPSRVWAALTDPKQLAEWAPFDADRDMSTTGPVALSVVGGPSPQVSKTAITRAEPPRLLEYSWGGGELRWELEPSDGGTKLTLWHNINRGYIAWGAAGWQVCLDVLERSLAGESIGRIVGMDALKLDGWKRVTAAYAQQFGIEVGPSPMGGEA